MVLAAKPKKPTSIHHRKRTGQHHKRTKAYHKSYWPYLPMVAIIVAGFLAHALWTPRAGVLAYATDISIGGLLSETNQERSAAGQGTLIINQQLMAAAQAKANDMVGRNYWSHVTPDGKQPWWFVTNAGYDYQATGENLAYGFESSVDTVTGWMNSPGHKANLLNGAYQDVGFGIANSSDYQGTGEQTIVVALYGKVMAATAPALPDAASPAPTVKPAQQAAPAPAPAAMAEPNSAPADQSSQPGANRPQPVPANGAADKIAVSASVRGNPASQPVSRLELVANVPQWSVLLTVLVLAAAATVLVLRHIIFWHKFVVRGEAFLVRHWKADLMAVSLITAGIVLTRTAGFIL